MRMMMIISFPHEKFNAAVKDGTVGRKMRGILEETRPEAVYFTEQHGKRCGVVVVNVEEPSRIPALAEPWFLNFNADIEFRIVMSQEDLQKSGLEELGKRWS